MAASGTSCMCPDGILSGLRMAELLSNKGKLSLNCFQKSHLTLTLSVKKITTCSKEAKVKVMENMEEPFLKKPHFDDISEINSIDGVRMTFEDDSWVLVRPSGTEDYIRITLESRDSQRAEEIKDVCVKIINENL